MEAYKFRVVRHCTGEIYKVYDTVVINHAACFVCLLDPASKNYNHSGEHIPSFTAILADECEEYLVDE